MNGAVSFRLPRVAAFLFASGACALVYQVAWFRELRLIFGASTAASAAVLAVFMGGLGVGGVVLGKRADRAENPLALYANLELLVAVTAALTPATVWLADRAYLATGGAGTLGDAGASVLRLLLAFLVLAPSTVAMGGTLPAAAKAVERDRDLGRQRLAMLYGVNTFGAVTGTLIANFLFLEVFGTRLTLWIACLVNAGVAVLARAAARSDGSRERAEDDGEDAAAARHGSEASRAFPWFPPLAAGIAGLAFMLMELVWYRMLGPLLGGSSYTFGLILAVALAGIGVGGAVYARTRAASTLTLFGVTCALEALFMLVPYALGDRLAIFAGLLRPLASAGFGTSILAWSVVVFVVTFPAAVVSGFQFPAIIGLYGSGKAEVGRDVGRAYAANTVGSIVGSLAGGFGLLPLLTAPRCWWLVGVVLLAAAALALALDARLRGISIGRVLAVSGPVLGAVLLSFAEGPTAVWRHSGVGSGRADRYFQSPDAESAIRFARRRASNVAWEADGRESSVALARDEGYSFLVNGKSDGHATVDAGTQVMSGLLMALLHPNPKTSLVIGLGTGSTAGWMGDVPGMERVDVVELEPAILRVARDCAPVNRHVLDNPRVHVTIGDAREVLRASRHTYDLVFSEPSNPYRAGISSLYTVEYYETARERLAPGGIFAQWIQAYEVDGFVIATALTTLRKVFPHVTIWQTTSGDLLLLAELAPRPIDLAALRERVKQTPFHEALRSTWQTTSAEGVLARFVADARLGELFEASTLGTLNTDDQNYLEFAFARSVGHHRVVDVELAALSARRGLHVPQVDGAYDATHVTEERVLAQLLGKDVYEARPWPLDPPAGRALTSLGEAPSKAALASWKRLGREPRSYREAYYVAEAASRTGDDSAPARILAVETESERGLLRAVWAEKRGDQAGAVDELERAFVAMREDPWTGERLANESLQAARRLGTVSPVFARRLSQALSKPFAVELLRLERMGARAALAFAAKDPLECVRALDELGPVPWEEPLLQLRARCLRDAGDPRTHEAEEELGLYVAHRKSFGPALYGPPPAPEATKPAPGSEPSEGPTDAGEPADAHEQKDAR